METIVLSEPKFVDVGGMSVAGLGQDYTREQMMDIPAQWEKFNASLAGSGLPYEATYGIIYPAVPMVYVTGIEVAAGIALPDSWERRDVPAQRYAVFSETGGVEAIRLAWPAIWTEWLPKSGRKVISGAAMIEKYSGEWVTSGDFEIWIPLQT